MPALRGQAGAPAATAPSAPAADGRAAPAIPGLVPGPRSGSAAPAAAPAPAPATAASGRESPAAKQAPAGKQTQAGKDGTVAPGGAAIPGLTEAADLVPRKTGSAYRRHHPSPVPRTGSGTRSQQAFIDEVAPGAIEAQHTYGVPAAVTIAQAIDESGWGQSQLAAQDHNLFGIKGTGPAGSVPLPTQEYVNGQPVNTSASFRVYHDAAESIADHGRLLAQSGYYQQAMAVRHNADKFAAALTGVYATDPNYGSNLISLMRRYDLYQYGATGPGQTTQRAPAAEPGSATIPGVGGAPPARPEPTGPAAPSAASHHPTRKHTPEPASTVTPDPARSATSQPTQTATPQPTGSPSPQPTRTATPQPAGTSTPQPTGTASPQPTGTGTGTGTASFQPAGTSSPQPARTASPQPTRTTTPGPGVTRSPRPAVSPQPAAAGSPHPSATDSPSATPAVPPSPAGSGPAAPPSVSPGQPDIPGVATESEAENAMTSAVRFGPASAFVPVAEPEADSALLSAVRFGPAAPFVPVAQSAPSRPAPSYPAPTESASSQSAWSHPAPARSAPAWPAPARSASARPAHGVRSAPAARAAAPARPGPAPVRATLVSARRYQRHIPRSVLNSFVETAKGPLVSEESFYRDVASFHGISWELLAACDWMQCDARPKRSPVYGEKLGTLNADGTVYTSKSAALARCAGDLVTLARSVYGIDLTSGAPLSVRDLANAFAAFRWGRVLKDHDFSAMKFPYSVAGLTENHLGLRWPEFAPRNSGDRPRGRFHRKFGAVPIVLSLDYPATV